MDTRSYPSSYVVSLGLILFLSLGMAQKLLTGWKWKPSLMPFFFLGSGFMLLETKAITELGLVFGNTWHIIGIAIIGVLVMAFLANLLATIFPPKRLAPIFFLVLATVLAGYVFATCREILPIISTNKFAMVVLLTCPLLFSGLIFSVLLKKSKDLTGALTYNILGAMVGGILEYNAMQFGFSFLYLLALALYGLAWGTSNSILSEVRLLKG